MECATTLKNYPRMNTQNDIFNHLEFGYCFYDVECLLGALDMKVGDLIQYNSYIGLIIKSDEWGTLVQWCDGEIIEDVANYFSAGLQIKVIS